MSEEEYIETLINARVSGTQFICEQYETVIQPLLVNVKLPCQNDIILKEIYPKMYLQMKSLTRLNNIYDYQAIMSIVRNLLENFLSIKSIIKGSIENANEKYLNYIDFGKYKAARRISKYASTNTKKLYETFFSEQLINDANEFVAANENRLRKQALYFWKRTEADNKGRIKTTNQLIPDYWHGYDWRRFAEINSEEDLYLEIYPFYSWFIHSGPTGSSLIAHNENNHMHKKLKSSFFFAHSMAAHLFIEATKLVMIDFKIDNIIEEYDMFIKRLRHAPEQMAIYEKLMEIKDSHPELRNRIDEEVKYLEQQLRDKEPE